MLFQFWVVSQLCTVIQLVFIPYDPKANYVNFMSEVVSSVTLFPLSLLGACILCILNIYLLMHRTNDSTWCWVLVSCEILIPIKFVFGVLSSHWQVPAFFHIILPTQSWLPRCCHLVGAASYYENNPITILTSFLSKVMSGLLIYLSLPSFIRQ